MTARASGERRILVIDDEPGIRKVIDRLLKQFGYDTLLAANGQDGIRLFEMNAPDIALVLLDWNLPGTSGRETLARLIALRADIRVILVTGAPEATTDEHATQDTVSILLKPFTPTELMLAVRTVLEA
ncbi:MAG TPA: response regulator [Gemmatimonadaceae bacterium]|nr:response regulator [Gemmatimonadaceae bacterium]